MPVMWLHTSLRNCTEELTENKIIYKNLT